MMIEVVSLSIVATGVSYPSDFKWTQKKKSKKLMFEKHEGHVTGLPRLIHLLGYLALSYTKGYCQIFSEFGQVKEKNERGRLTSHYKMGRWLSTTDARPYSSDKDDTFSFNLHITSRQKKIGEGKGSPGERTDGRRTEKRREEKTGETEKKKDKKVGERERTEGGRRRVRERRVRERERTKGEGKSRGERERSPSCNRKKG
ncbi:hypothetical protein TNCV_1723151 [Trichonephila clavipes]|nr:hypothetical protein TNCV_1723151 [Trichonephila clavipes]